MPGTQEYVTTIYTTTNIKSP